MSRGQGDNRQQHRMITETPKFKRLAGMFEVLLQLEKGDKKK